MFSMQTFFADAAVFVDNRLADMSSRADAQRRAGVASIVVVIFRGLVIVVTHDDGIANHGVSSRFDNASRSRCFRSPRPLRSQQPSASKLPRTVAPSIREGGRKRALEYNGASAVINSKGGVLPASSRLAS